MLSWKNNKKYELRTHFSADIWLSSGTPLKSDYTAKGLRYIKMLQVSH